MWKIEGNCSSHLLFQVLSSQGRQHALATRRYSAALSAPLLFRCDLSVLTWWGASIRIHLLINVCAVVMLLTLLPITEDLELSGYTSRVDLTHFLSFTICFGMCKCVKLFAVGANPVPHLVEQLRDCLLVYIDYVDITETHQVVLIDFWDGEHHFNQAYLELITKSASKYRMACVETLIKLKSVLMFVFYRPLSM